MLRWIPQWYELDWTVVVGDIDWFILSQDTFVNGMFHDEEDYPATKIKITSMNHSDLCFLMQSLHINELKTIRSLKYHSPRVVSRTTTLV